MARSADALKSTMRRELTRIREDRLTRWLMLWLPIAGCVLLIWTFWPRTITEMPVVLVDNDNSAQSRALARAIDATPAARITERALDMRQAATQVLSGRSYAAIEIPAKFEHDLLRGQQTTVSLLVDEQALPAANAITTAVETTAMTLSATLATNLRMRQGTPEYAAIAASQPIRTQVHPLFNPGIDYAAFLAIALVTATLHSFVIMHAVMAFATERRDRTVPLWAEAAGGKPIVAMIGKLVPLIVWWSAFGLATMLGTFAVLGMRGPANLFVYCCGFTLLVLSYLVIGASMALWFPRLHLAASAASLIAAPAIAFCGLTFPLPAMPLGARLAGQILPLTHFIHLQVSQVIMRTPASYSWPQLLQLAAFVVGFAVLAFLGMRRCVHREASS